MLPSYFLFLWRSLKPVVLGREAATMLQFILGFAFGNVVGMYLAQNYEVPDIVKKFEDFKKDLDTKKRPPSD